MLIIFYSDATAFMDITRTSIVLEDGQWAQIKRGDKMFCIRNMQQEEQAFTLETIIGDISLVEKAGFDHHMIKEITRQPESLSNCLRGRVSADGRVHLGGLSAIINHNGRSISPLDAMRAARQVQLRPPSARRPSSRSATDYYLRVWDELARGVGGGVPAGDAGQHSRGSGVRQRVPLQARACITCITSVASRPHAVLVLRVTVSRSAPLNKDEDVVIVVSQSGETADTLAALRLAKSKVRAIPAPPTPSLMLQQGVLVIGVCNAVGSTIARETDAGVYLHAGPEIGVASTKAFTAQVAVLSMMAISIGVSNGTTSAAEGEELGRALLRIPEAVEHCITSCSSICKQVALEYWLANNFLFLGRAIHYPVALEGALKLKEISYIHAEGLPAAEMKHGHIALVDNRMPVVVIAQRDARIFEKIVSNIQEVQARGGRVICVCSEASESLDRLCEHVIFVPSVHPLLDALVTVRASLAQRISLICTRHVVCEA
jgi:glucosamine 6-phosphate synthetase-like amidotransferase/phosphosugar isomerase protein